MTTLGRGQRPSHSSETIIDLTMDDTQENHIIPHKLGDEPLANIVTHPFISSIIPQKRNARESPKATRTTRTRSSSRARSVGSGKMSAADRLGSSSPTTTTQIKKPVRVVIPRPSPELQRRIEETEKDSSSYIGVSNNFFPTDHFEQMAAQRTYPQAKPRDPASKIPLEMSPGPWPLAQIGLVDATESIRRTLKFKLSVIDGPQISYDMEDVKNLPYLATNFDFINDYKLQKDVKTIPSEFVGGCGCSPACFLKCTCLDRTEETEEPIVPYSIIYGLLTAELLNRDAMIYECNPKCDCSSSKSKCWNHIVQKGRTNRLEIFHTGNHGFGLRSPDPLRAGQFIARYLGEVITKEKARVREVISLKDQSYLFDLDWYGECRYVVDGQKFGSATRFMNHSCNPNCKMIPVSTVQGDNHHLYDLAFFARRDIPPYTELTFDYNPGATRSEKIDANTVPCLCGESNCRKQLWANRRKGTM
ncbi:uncharacterized protein PFLUO_LOCUS24 [Penicillium psychrofluorescens]|uniref:uncharacterized protein n=1 Tax=Penicillium psychrofluorescens TaxID=3158075 RepID=UPI003CCD08B2